MRTTWQQKEIRIEFLILYFKKYKKVWEGYGEIDSECGDKLSNLHDWCRSQEMTIYEFLFLDDIVLRIDEKEFASVLEKKKSKILDPIKLQAKFAIDKLKSDHNLGEIREKIDSYIRYTWYAKKRCAEFFNIGVLNLSYKKVMFDYSREWKWRLKEEINNRKIC